MQQILYILLGKMRETPNGQREGPLWLISYVMHFTWKQENYLILIFSSSSFFRAKNEGSVCEEKNCTENVRPKMEQPICGKSRKRPEEKYNPKNEQRPEDNADRATQEKNRGNFQFPFQPPTSGQTFHQQPQQYKA